MVAAIKSGGTNIPAEKALDHVYGYALGLDMTRRDLQNGMAAEKKPWEIGKSFDQCRRDRSDPSREPRPAFHRGRYFARDQRHGQAKLGPART